MTIQEIFEADNPNEGREKSNSNFTELDSRSSGLEAGLTGEVILKLSNAEGDFDWRNPADAAIKGDTGDNSYSVTAASFTQPAPAATVSVTVDSTSWMGVNQEVYVENGGYYFVSSITDATHVVLNNRGYPGNASGGATVASASEVSPAGARGATGSTGATGPASYTTTTASFTQPSVSSTVSVTVGDTSWMAVSEAIYVEGGGYYTVSSITDATHVVLTNSGAPGNASPTSTITSPKVVTASGVQGATGGSGHTIKDEGTPLTTRDNLNFIGTGVAVTDDSGGNKTDVTINGAFDEIRFNTGTSALATEGYESYDSTVKRIRFHDGVRERAVNSAGFMPYAYPIGANATMTFSTALAIAANGGTAAIPVVLHGHMLLEAVIFRNTDTSTARGPAEFAIFEDRLDSSNTLDLITGAVGTLASWTPGSASNRTISVTSPPVYLAPGLYWICLKNNHATNTLGLGTLAGATLAINTFQTKTLTTSAFGSTLDFVAITWTKQTSIAGVALLGRVFGQSTQF